MIEDVGGNPITNVFRGLLIGSWIATLICWERRKVLRPVRDNKLRRDVRNFGMAALAGAVVQLMEAPVAFWLARRAEKMQAGLLQHVPGPSIVRIGLGIVLLDYTLYQWHVLTHRVPFLWRFHQVHHIDREMDASTALRFHFGEIALSVAYRAAQIRIIGPDPTTVAGWQIFLFLCILFHHSNVRLPLAWERRAAWFVVTPRLHGIHHSIAPHEVNSNWSSGLTIWDWLHGTLRTDIPQKAIVIGVSGHLNDRDQTIGNLLTLPFRESTSVPPMSPRSVRQLPSLLT